MLNKNKSVIYKYKCYIFAKEIITKKYLIMETIILASKTGLMNMGGYTKEKTAQVFTHVFNINGVEENDVYFRFKYVGDSCDECFKTLEEAMRVFEKATKYIN